MKKLSALFTAIIIAIILFTGCTNNPSDAVEPTKSDFSYDMLLQLPKTYIGNPNNIEYESLNQYITECFSDSQNKGAIASVECVETIFYITVRHDGEDIMVSGKAVAKSKITSIIEKYNGFDIKPETIVELEQDYYIMPIHEKDALEMFKSFGATFHEDSTGEVSGMDIKDGNYVLKIKENVDYTLKINYNVLPLENGECYTGVITGNNSVSTIQFLSPVENTQRYEAFQMNQSTANIASEVKSKFDS